MDRETMEPIWSFLQDLNGVLWHDVILYLLLAVGVLFTVWTFFGQYRALTHGVAVVRGKYDRKDDPGAINHFQALSAALSATIGLGNIGGVALAISLGGPGAVFWMWIVGLFGMALKMTEVTLSMLYRNTDDPDDPHGGPMWAAKVAFGEVGWKRTGSLVGGLFCISLLTATLTGGAMFQAWNVADVTRAYFDVPALFTGIIISLTVGAVIIGGIKRIGAAAGRIVPFMCTAYLIAAIYVVFSRIEDVPEMLSLIFTSAFDPLEAQGAFLGGTLGFVFYTGLSRAIYSNEAGQGSAPIAHSAAKTDEPVREGIVAGLGPFIDTLCVCTLTALVILLSGVWNRTPEARFTEEPPVTRIEGGWTLGPSLLPARADGEPWNEGEKVFAILSAEPSTGTERTLQKLPGTIVREDDALAIQWGLIPGDQEPELSEGGIYATYTGATLTARAFDSINSGLGKWLVTLAAWLFAISTMIAWSYYGEQGVLYLFGRHAVLPYKATFCALVIVSTFGFIRTDMQLNVLTTFGTGLMLWANVPIMLIFARKPMRAYHDYLRRLKSGEMHPHAAASIQDIVEGKD